MIGRGVEIAVGFAKRLTSLLTLDVAPLDAAPLDAAPLDAAPLDAAPLDVAPLDVGWGVGTGPWCIPIVLSFFDTRRSRIG